MQQTIAERRGEPEADTTTPSLRFVEDPDSAEAWLTTACELLEGGRRMLGVRLLDDRRAPIVGRLVDALGDAIGIIGKPLGLDGRDLPPMIDATEADAILLVGGDAEAVAAALMDYVDHLSATIVAPTTTRYWRCQPLYLISIPKAGTHLLFKLAEAFGYKPGGTSPQRPTGGYWYYLLNSNAHTGADEFFQDALQRAPFGNRAHPFMRSPALFNYRNPLDILVSEANYFHLDGKSPLSVLLSPLSFEARVDKLIGDPWLLGSIRDRVGRFASWLDCANVIPVSFEEMVGEAGGGSNAALDRLIWSIQIKLHVPGNPAHYRAALLHRDSATFREGRIGGWRRSLTERQISRIRQMPQDFMTSYGFDADAEQDVLPLRADAYRHRPLKLSKVDFTQTPMLIQTDVLGHNIVVYRNRHIAVPTSSGELDLTTLSERELAAFPQAESLENVVATVISNDAIARAQSGSEEALRKLQAEAEVSQSRQTNLPIQLFTLGEFNVVRHRSTVYGIRQRLGPIEFEPGPDTLRALYPAHDLIVARSASDVVAQILRSDMEQLRRQVGDANARLPLEIPQALDALYPSLVGRLDADLRPAMAQATRPEIAAALAERMPEEAERVFERLRPQIVTALEEELRQEVTRLTQAEVASATERLMSKVERDLAKGVAASQSVLLDQLRATLQSEMPRAIEASQPALLERLRVDVHNAIYSPIAGDLHRELTRVMVPEVVGLVQGEVKTSMQRESVGQAWPVGRFLGYNLFRRNDALLAVPQRIGAVDPLDASLRYRPGVIASRSAFRARLRIIWRWIRWAYWDGAKV